MTSIPQNIYDSLEHPKTCAPDDFWGQVRRTLHGKPVPQEQINLMFAIIGGAMDFEPEDALLDICCGNGALGSHFFHEVKEYLGVDMSPCLIDIANRNFDRPPTHRFVLQPAQEYCTGEQHPSRFTKILLYGAFAYFSPPAAHALLHQLRCRFTRVRRFFIGAIPDAACADAFFEDRERPDLNDHSTSIGRWYSRQELCDLAEAAGWRAQLVPSPPHFYQSHYRFHALLTPVA